MPPSQPVTTRHGPRALLEDHLELVGRIVSWISRRLGLSPDEAEELRSWVHLKLTEDEYRVLREHSGRGGMASYLTVVIQNLGRDFRMQRWGRWRPSAAAERLGVLAVELETLLHRDRRPLGEAVETLLSRGGRRSRHELEALAEQLPARVPRLFEREEALEAAAVVEGAADGVEAAEREATLSRVQEAIAAAMRKLEVEDRLILKMHFRSGLTIAAIASALGLQQRSVYTRRDRSLRALRRALEARGLVAAEVLEAAGWAEGELAVDYGVEEVRPSNPVEADAGEEEEGSP